MTTASAPGKIILFGEHAVVYGHPALAVPVNQVQATAMVSKAVRAGVWIDAPDIHLSSELSRLPHHHPLAAVIRNVFKFQNVSVFPALTILISSTIPIASGLGSGTAVSVAIIRALSSFLQAPLTTEQVSLLAYEIEKLHHGTPSGIDNTVVTYAKPVYFVKDQPVETFRVGKPFTLIIGDTGISAPTKEAVGDVHRLWEADKPHWEMVFDQVGRIARHARHAIETGDIPALGPLMNENHKLLQEMTVSSLELERLVEASRRSGALGAKLSGGGRGGNMIALVQKENAPAVAEALMAAGSRGTILTVVE